MSAAQLVCAQHVAGLNGGRLAAAAGCALRGVSGQLTRVLVTTGRRRIAVSAARTHPANLSRPARLGLNLGRGLGLGSHRPLQVHPRVGLCTAAPQTSRRSNPDLPPGFAAPPPSKPVAPAAGPILTSENAKADAKGAPPSPASPTNTANTPGAATPTKGSAAEASAASASAAKPPPSAQPKPAAEPSPAAAPPPSPATGARPETPRGDESVQYWEEGAKKPSELLEPPAKPLVERLQQGWAAFQKGLASFGAASMDLLQHPSKIPPALSHFWGHMKEELKTYWQGSKLLWHDVKTATKLVSRITKGHTLTRRERRQLIRTTSDMLRLVPFAMFVIIPFMELLLPVALKLFPNMLPSTFTSQHKREEDLKRQLQLRLHLASFLQDTMASVAQKRLNAEGESKDSARELLKLIEKVRQGRRPTNEELYRLAKVFSDDITLDNVGRPQLVNMCKYMGLNPYGTDLLLRYQLRRQMESIKKDDLAIRQEGLDSLSYQELVSACRTRGMRTTGLTMAGYKRNLKQWLELSLDLQVPPTLLIMSRALAIQEVPTAPGKPKAKSAATPEDQESADNLASALGSLDEEVIEEVLVESGISDRSLKLEVLERQNQLIAEELQEKEEQETLEGQKRQKREEILQKLLTQEKEAKRKLVAEEQPTAAGEAAGAAGDAASAGADADAEVSLIEEERKRQESREIDRKIDAHLDEIVDDIAIMVSTSALMEEREMLQAEKAKYETRLRLQAEKLAAEGAAAGAADGSGRRKRLFNLRSVLNTLPEFSAAQLYFMQQLHALGGTVNQGPTAPPSPRGFDTLRLPSEEELRAIIDKNRRFVEAQPREELPAEDAVPTVLSAPSEAAAAPAPASPKQTFAGIPEELVRISRLDPDASLEEILEAEAEAKLASQKQRESAALSRVESQLDAQLRKMLKKIEEEIEVVDAMIGDKLKLLDDKTGQGRITFEELTLAVKKHLKSYSTDEEAARVVHRLRDLCEMDDPPFLRGIKRSISVEDVRKVFRDADERLAKRQQLLQEQLEREERERELKKLQQAKKEEAPAAPAAAAAAAAASASAAPKATPKVTPGSPGKQQ